MSGLAWRAGRFAGVWSAGLCALALAAPSPASASTVEVGVGRADITPLTGGFKGGWLCTCARALGQHTRLFARAVVLAEGDRKIALVAVDLAFMTNGMLRDAATMLTDRGFAEQNVLVSATHTHGSQTGYMNYPFYNSVQPKTDELDGFSLSGAPPDPAMYSFMTRQLAAAIRRADEGRRPGAVGWGSSEIVGLTENRSLEAHLANYGLDVPVGEGHVHQHPGGYRATIDPAVDVLRVDQYRGTRRVPVGMFSTFANHGTVVRPTFPFFTADHNGAAQRVVEAEIRRVGRVPGDQEVVSAFTNSDAGDMSSALHRSGPAAAEEVGRREAGALLDAWRAAGRSMSRAAGLDLRFTRVCMCGQHTSDGPSDSTPWIAQAQAAGSEEGRTIYFDLGLAYEGARLPVGVGPQGRKVPVVQEEGSMPASVPLQVVRIGGRAMATIPGEPTVGVGNMIRAAVGDAAGGSLERVVVVGYANEYLDYWTTPAEYDQQHYEGGSTQYGRTSTLVLRDALIDLTERLVAGRPDPEPYVDDVNQGTHASAADFGAGAERGSLTEQPRGAARLEHPMVVWHGGPNGIDRSVDRPFVSLERRVRGGWQPLTDDLGLQIVWSSDAYGGYTARWEVPLSAAVGIYRFRISAKRYALTSAPFTVEPARSLRPSVIDGHVELGYPRAVVDRDWTARPEAASGGRITYTVDGRPVTVRRRRGIAFPVPAGERVTIAAEAARDRHGNTNADAVRVR